jgi:lipopolysaccharide transport system permease protein
MNGKRVRQTITVDKMRNCSLAVSENATYFIVIRSIKSWNRIWDDKGRWVGAPMIRLPINWTLTFDFSRREIEKKYRGAYLGIIWIFLSPLLMLAVYTFVYSYIFRVKVTGMDRVDFVLWLYAGLMVFFFFSEVVTMAPTCIRGSPNYVKKVIFPLEVLIGSKIISAFVSFCINFLLLIACLLLKQHALHGTVILAPLVLLPTLLLSYGVALILASVGVFVRDIDEISRFLIRVLFYLAPIVYPLSLVPDEFSGFIWMNPLTSMVENFRTVIFFGILPDWHSFSGFGALSLITFLVGRSCFVKLRPAFADVL